MPLTQSMYYAESTGADPLRPVLVLVHGAGYDHHIWPMEIRRMSGWRVLTVDLPGHGRSAGRPRQSVGAYVQDLVNFLDELAIYRIVLVGHSLGASIALQLADEQPALLAGLGLISASAHLQVPELLAAYFSNPLTIPLGIQLYQAWGFSPQSSLSLVESGLAPLRAARAVMLGADWQASARFDFDGDLGQIQAPAWVATGGDDRLAPLPCAHYLASNLASSRLQVIPNAGHMLPLEQPAALSSGLRQFLAKLSPLEQNRQTKATPALTLRERGN